MILASPDQIGDVIPKMKVFATHTERIEIGLEARSLANPTSRLLMAVGHGYYRKAPMNMNLSHGGVCIFIMGVILSRDPWLAYVSTIIAGGPTPPIYSGRAA